MSEPVAPNGDEFGVELHWPHGDVLPADLPRSSAGDASAEPAAADRGEGEPSDIVLLRRVLGEYLGGRADELGRMMRSVNQLRAGIDDVSGVVHRLAASTEALAAEVSSLVDVTRRNAKQTASLGTLAESMARNMNEGLSELRVELAQVGDEVSAVRRRLPVQARDAATPR